MRGKGGREEGTCMAVGGGGHAWQGGGMRSGETAIEAGGTHPNGMYSCLECNCSCVGGNT